MQHPLSSKPLKLVHPWISLPDVIVHVDPSYLTWKSDRRTLSLMLSVLRKNPRLIALALASILVLATGPFSLAQGAPPHAGQFDEMASDAMASGDRHGHHHGSDLTDHDKSPAPETAADCCHDMGLCSSVALATFNPAAQPLALTATIFPIQGNETCLSHDPGLDLPPPRLS